MIAAIILAGGEGRRLKGLDKGWVKLAHKPLIQHVIQRIQPQVDMIYISANRHMAEYATLGFPVIEDISVWRGLGPLSGVASVMEVMPQSYQSIQLINCDYPFLPINLVQHLFEQRQQQTFKAAVPYHEARHHYGLAQLSYWQAKTAADCLAKNDRRLRAVLGEFVTIEFLSDHAFMNCNTFEMLSIAEGHIEPVVLNIKNNL